jgi:glycerol-3-phosphate dehydrogenase
MLDGARAEPDLGAPLGGGLSERELAWMRRHEWARSADDVLWRRSKLGLRMSAAEREALAARMG